MFNYCIHFMTVEMHAVLIYVFHGNTNVLYFGIKKFSQLKHIPQCDLILKKSYNLIQSC